MFSPLAADGRMAKVCHVPALCADLIPPTENPKVTLPHVLLFDGCGGTIASSSGIPEHSDRHRKGHRGRACKPVYPVTRAHAVVLQALLEHLGWNLRSTGSPLDWGPCKRCLSLG